MKTKMTLSTDLILHDSVLVESVTRGAIRDENCRIDWYDTFSVIRIATRRRALALGITFQVRLLEAWTYGVSFR